ncbi:MAG TPA: hypothetical protein PKD38_19840 [Nitrospira sp.]|nr:hypothetical protein [Nitrospira sp.]
MDFYTFRLRLGQQGGFACNKRHFRLAHAILAFVLASWAPAVLAFQINTCLRDLTYKNGVLDAERHGNRWRNVCGFAPERYRYRAVHEHMTAFAVSKHRGTQHWLAEPDQPGKFRYLVEHRWPKGAKQTHSTMYIIFGTWWNDDPLMLMWGEYWDLVEGMKRMERFFESPEKYPVSRGDKTLDATDSLGWHSHFGRLQHLHFMTDLPMSPTLRQKRVRTTREKALQWMQFAYNVATRKEGFRPADKLDPTMAEELGLPSIALNHDVNDANVKIRTLFARFDVRNREARPPDIALGSMLHILQDSFSPAHTCRVEAIVDGKRTAILHDVYNYNAQDDKKHKELDDIPQWLLRYAKTKEHDYVNDPIVAGAWIIGAVQNGLEWNQVEKYLRSTIFRSVEPDHAVSVSKCIGEKV